MHARHIEIGTASNDEEDGAGIRGTGPNRIDVSAASVERNAPIGTEPRRQPLIIEDIPCVENALRFDDFAILHVRVHDIVDRQTRVPLDLPIRERDVVRVGDDEGGLENVIHDEFTGSGEFNGRASIDEYGSIYIVADLQTHRTIHDQLECPMSGCGKGAGGALRVVRCSVARYPTADVGLRGAAERRGGVSPAVVAMLGAAAGEKNP